MAQSVIVGGLSQEKRAEVIRDIYKKQAAELLVIEEAHNKLVMLILGVLGAGASFLGSSQAPSLSMAGKAGLTAVVVAMLAIGAIYTHHRNGARVGVRTILVRCEEALGMFQPDVYVDDAMLDEAYRQFPAKGGWLRLSFFFTVVAGAGVLFVLWGR